MKIGRKSIKLGAIADFRNGLNYTKISHGIGCKIIGVSDFQDNFTPEYDKLEQINPEGITQYDDYIKKGDVVFVRSNGNKALVGRSMYIDREVEALFSGFCIRARINDPLIDPLFFAYYTRTKHFKKSIASSAGTNINNLNQGLLKNVDVPLFSKDAQTQICNVLSALDQKIELNNRINRELEGLAKLLYDYWFVQFDFPMTAEQAAALGKPHLTGQPYKSSGGPMLHNSILKRNIPAGWEVGELADIANIIMGQSPPGESYNEDEHGDVFFQGSTDFGWRYPQVRQYTTAATRIANPGNILLSVRAPVGTLNIAPMRCAIGRGLSALSSKDGHDVFLFYVMVYFKQVFDRRNTEGTTFGCINRDDLRSLKLAIPPKPLLDAFTEHTQSGHEKIFNNHQQNQELTQLRDWLLPMLMNGQVCVNPSFPLQNAD